MSNGDVLVKKRCKRYEVKGINVLIYPRGPEENRKWERNISTWVNTGERKWATRVRMLENIEEAQKYKRS